MMLFVSAAVTSGLVFGVFRRLSLLKEKTRYPVKAAKISSIILHTSQKKFWYYYCTKKQTKSIQTIVTFLKNKDIFRKNDYDLRLILLLLWFYRLYRLLSDYRLYNFFTIF